MGISPSLLPYNFAQRQRPLLPSLYCTRMTLLNGCHSHNYNNYRGNDKILDGLKAYLLRMLQGGGGEGKRGPPRNLISSNLVENSSLLCGKDLALGEVSLGLLPSKNTSAPLRTRSAPVMGVYLLALLQGVMEEKARPWSPSPPSGSPGHSDPSIPAQASHCLAM